MQNVPDDIAEQIGNLFQAFENGAAADDPKKSDAAARAAVKAGTKLAALALADLRAIADYCRAHEPPARPNTDA